MSITLTEKAATKVQSLMTEQSSPDGAGLRVKVVGGGLLRPLLPARPRQGLDARRQGLRVAGHQDLPRSEERAVRQRHRDRLAGVDDGRRVRVQEPARQGLVRLRDVVHGVGRTALSRSRRRPAPPRSRHVVPHPHVAPSLDVGGGGGVRPVARRVVPGRLRLEGPLRRRARARGAARAAVEARHGGRGEGTARGARAGGVPRRVRRRAVASSPRATSTPTRRTRSSASCCPSPTRRPTRWGTTSRATSRSSRRGWRARSRPIPGPNAPTSRRPSPRPSREGVRAVLTDGLAGGADALVSLGASTAPLSKVLAGLVSVAVSLACLRWALAIEADAAAGATRPSRSIPGSSRRCCPRETPPHSRGPWRGASARGARGRARAAVSCRSPPRGARA